MAVEITFSDLDSNALEKALVFAHGCDLEIPEPSFVIRETETICTAH